MVTVRGLGKRYGGRWLFQGLDCDLGAGDCLIVGGHNGSGKSTLLKCLAGLVSATEGTVDLGILEPRTELGYSALDLSTYPQLTAREHLELFASIRGSVVDAGAHLESVGLTQHDLPAGQLSSGQRSRLRLALATMTSPKILILDEPGAAMDERGRELVARLVASQRERGCAILATNDPLERRFGTHVLEL